MSRGSKVHRKGKRGLHSCTQLLALVPFAPHGGCSSMHTGQANPRTGSGGRGESICKDEMLILRKHEGILWIIQSGISLTRVTQQSSNEMLTATASSSDKQTGWWTTGEWFLAGARAGGGTMNRQHVVSAQIPHNKCQHCGGGVMIWASCGHRVNNELF